MRLRRSRNRVRENTGEENEGTAVFHLDPTSGALTHLQAVLGLRNPSFLALYPKLPVL
jgi:hypothetical protein